MRKGRRTSRIVTACAVALMAPTPITLIHAASAQASPCQPLVTGATALDPAHNVQHYATPGSLVTITGASLATPECAATAVSIGRWSTGRSGFAVAPNGSSISLMPPPGASGAVTVSVTDRQGRVSTSNANFVFVTVPFATVQDASPVVGTPLEVDGQGFGAFMPEGSGGVPDAQVVGIYPSCAGARRAPASVLSDSTITLAAPPYYCVSALTLQMSVPADTSRHKDCTTNSSLTWNCVIVDVDAGVVDPAFLITSASAPPGATVSPGDAITVRGTGFGAAGSAFIGAQPMLVTWTGTLITAKVPAGARSGVMVLRRATGDLLAMPLGQYSVAGMPSAGVATDATAAQVQLSVMPVESQAPPGSRVDLEVLYTIGGRPVSGAPVGFSVLASPGDGATLAVAAGETDRHGSSSSSVRLSVTAGPHLVGARVGIYSATAALVAERAPSILGGRLPFGLSALHIQAAGSPVVVSLTLGAIVLVAFGVVVTAGVLARGIWRVIVWRAIRRVRRAH